MPKMSEWKQEFPGKLTGRNAGKSGRIGAQNVIAKERSTGKTDGQKRRKVRENRCPGTGKMETG